MMDSTAPKGVTATLVIEPGSTLSINGHIVWRWPFDATCDASAFAGIALSDNHDPGDEDR
jgi:hypothetical protein